MLKIARVWTAVFWLACGAAATAQDVAPLADLEGGGDPAEGGGGDTVPPAQIQDLTAVAMSPTSVYLSWTAPGDDGTTGTASGYIVHVSTVPYSSAFPFNAGTPVDGEPAPEPSGSLQSMMVNGLVPETTCYFAIRAWDNASRFGEPSNTASASTFAAPGPEPTATPDPAAPNGDSGDSGSCGGSASAAHCLAPLAVLATLIRQVPA